MRLPTYTSIWHLERRLYKIEDWVLPVPISLLQGGVFLAAGACWWITLHLFGVGFGAETGWLFLVPPAIAAWGAGKPVAEEKRAHELVVSQLRYCLQPRTLVRLTEPHEPPQILVHATVWADPAARPDPTPPPSVRPPDVPAAADEGWPTTPPAPPSRGVTNGNGHPGPAPDAGSRLRDLLDGHRQATPNGDASPPRGRSAARPGPATGPGATASPRPDARSSHDAP